MRFTPEDYSEPLALYLGDGYVSEGLRTQRLRLHLDARYPLINGEIEAPLQRCFPANPVTRVRPPVSKWSGRRDTLVILSVYSRHLGCLFPSTGEDGSTSDESPSRAGSGGCSRRPRGRFYAGASGRTVARFINRTDVHRSRPYEYLSYGFSNLSKDIVDLFTTACDLVGIHDYRVSGKGGQRWDIRIKPRASVARMLEYVGLKQ
jgi:hypothetical protein